MTTKEFSEQFDIVYNNIASNQSPGVDEYEKSVFLTNAQNDIIRAYFLNLHNKSLKGFDGNERRQIDFSSIISTKTIANFIYDPAGFKEGSKSIDIPDNVLYILNEFVLVDRDGKDTTLVVLPINYLEYSRFMTKPFKRPMKNQAWRIIKSSVNTRRSELVVGPEDKIESYTIRYVRKPKPIILEDLEEGLTIDGKREKTECELDSSIHNDILQRAVELAKVAYTGDVQSHIAIGTMSKTDIGMIGGRG